MASDEEPYVKKINSKYLISGYSRENSKPSTYISSSILDIIFFYFPKINGYKFIWKISASNNISTLKSLDSDAFDIGCLSNKFFLKLQTLSNLSRSQTKRTRNNINQSSWNTATGHSGGFFNNNTNNTNRNTSEDNIDPHTIENDCFALSLMSFPLPSKYNYAIIHFEMYCYEINEEYSAIWVLNNQRNYIQAGESVPPFNMNQNNNPDNDTLNLIQTSWNIFSNDTLMHFLSRFGVTFECKLNVLKLIPRNDQNNFSWGGNYRRRNRHKTSYVDDMKPYSYECIEYENQNKMRFSWNVSNSLIQKLINETFVTKADIMFHSDVYYDMLQLKITGKPNQKQICFSVMLCGLPQNTTRMGIKLELFSTDINGCKIKIMSEIVTFSYNKAIYNLSKDKNEIIYKLIMEHKKLIIFCKANIIQKYDNMGDLVMNKKVIHIDNNNNEIEQKSDESDNEQKIDNNNFNIHVNTKQFTDSNAKIFKPEKDVFLWHLNRKTDRNLINRIKNISIDEHFTSDVFELFGYKWYISIHAGDTVSGSANWNAGWGGNQLRNSGQHITPDIIGIFVNSLCTQSIQIDCKISIQILQTNKKHSYFQRYIGGEIQRRNNPYQKDFLQYGLSRLMNLNEITVKIEMDMIYEGLRNHSFGFGIDAARKEKDEKGKVKILNTEVKKWLCDIVGLKEYCNTFKIHDINDMEIVKLIKIDDIKAMGIKKVGHQIKLLSNIKLL